MSVRFILAVVLLLVAAPLSGQDPAGAASVWGDIVDEWRTAIDEQGIVGASLGLASEGEMVEHV